VFVGIDAGTSLVKAAAFDESGAVLAVESARARLDLRDDRAEQDAEEIFTAVRDVAGAVRADQAALIAITGQGDGLWLLDAQGRPVRPAISWLDGRAAGLVAEWTASGVLDEVFRRTGNALFPGCPGPLLAWLDRHEPASLDTAATAAYCKDMIFQRFTGLRATDVSDASVPFLDPHTRDYDAAALAACGLTGRAGLLAPIADPYPQGTTRDGIAVTAGPFDVPACAIGAGVTEPGDGLLIIGTTLACLVVSESVERSGEPSGFCFSTAAPGRWLRGMPAMTGTAGLDWVLATVGASHEDLAALLAASPPGARGIRVLPHFSGERAPFIEPAARGELTGITLRTTPADLVRATCEGIAYAARHCLEAAGLRGALTVTGGGARSEPWLQIFADVLGRPLRLAPAETGARGAVLNAVKDLDHAAWTRPSGVREPHPAAAAFYDEQYAAYLARVADARRRWGTS
jgi:erythritol kinase